MDLYEFYLVPADPDQHLSIREWSRIRTLLLEFQPASRSRSWDSRHQQFELWPSGGT